MAIFNIDTSPSARFRPIPTSLLQFPPASLPATLPPPSGQPSFAHPFAIPHNIYNGLLSVQVPIIVALIYATTTITLNQYNEKRNYKPWAVSKTRAFRTFVIAHNVFLALYSAWTFVAMLHAVRISLDGATKQHGWVGAVDALCKINGPRGLGDAATFNTSTGAWGFTNRALKLAADSMPDTTDIGRIWNEGLAFYGWLFYLSKFYEVFDTFIILAKGKKSSLLQTYHHAGAMMCMWAGIRYMAPPIWMFVLVNSFIHTLMYTYYTATALNVKVPNQIKRLITTMQIVQFVFGATFAFAHLFIAYTIPISTPYTYSLADLTSAVASDMSAAASTATASATAGIGSWLKKVAFRAAGEEGLAENVRNDQGEAFGIDAIHAAKDLKARQETRYRDEYRLIHCTDTSGQVFAILINCFYLAPLTLLFARFFVRSYMKRSDNQNQTFKRHLIEKSGKDAAKNMKKELDQALDEEPGSVQDSDARKSTPKEGADGTDTKDDGRIRKESEKQDEQDSMPDERKNSKQDEQQNSMPHESQKSKQDADSKQNGKLEDDATSTQGNTPGQDDKPEQDTKPTPNDKPQQDGNPKQDDDSKQDGNSKQGSNSKADEKTNQNGEPEADTTSKQDDNPEPEPDNTAEQDEGAEDEAEDDDVEILDSAEAVTDVLDAGMENADKFSKDLKDSKAG